jgi:hypothetical protein
MIWWVDAGYYSKMWKGPAVTTPTVYELSRIGKFDMGLKTIEADTEINPPPPSIKK